jgi:hypothetical protein
MKSWVLVAGLLAAAAATPALAADMDDGKTPYPKGGIYDDSRYPPKGPPPGYYEDDDDDDGPRTPPNKFSGPPPPDKYGPPPPYKFSGPPPPDKFSGPPPPDKYGPPPPNKFSGVTPPGKCVRSEEVRDRLTNLGWREFHAGQPVNENIVTLRARRPNGRLFELTLHRCSGQIVDARPLEPRPYAFNGPEGPRGPGTWGAYGYHDRWFFDRPYAYRWRRWYRQDD